jgi:uncharacterized protein (DUF2147 family)
MQAPQLPGRWRPLAIYAAEMGGGLMMRISSAMAVVVLGLTMASGGVLAQAAEDAFGVWLNPDDKSNIELYKCGEGLCAKITKLVDEKATDEKNPDAAKRARPIVGLVIMDGAKKSGTLYNPTDGKSYSGTVTIKTKNAVDLSGCVAYVLCRTTTWTRVNSWAVVLSRVGGSRLPRGRRSPMPR